MIPDYEGAKNYALERLKGELSPELSYHSLDHTLRGVVPALERLATLESVQGEELDLLRTAAYFHDIGYVENCEHHEKIGAQIVERVLPRFGFTSEQIGAIQRMILATELPQSPKNLLEMILVDADLDVLGRDDFLDTSIQLRAERATQGMLVSEIEWFCSQLEFLQSHQYWTQAAKRLREPKKRENMALLKKLIRESKANQQQKGCD
jgi:uncharacterized protein